MEDENTSPNYNTSPMENPPKKKTFSQVASTFKNKPSKFTELAKQYANNTYYNTGFGESKYDDNFNFDSEFNEADPLGSINEHRAQEQSGIVKAGAGLLRTASKAVTEVAKLPGVVFGIVDATLEKLGDKEDTHFLDTAFNNQWIKALDSINENVNTEALPVYVKKAVKEGNLWDNISSVDFWATDGADGAGFIAAMMAPGAAFQYAKLGSKLIEGLGKSAKFAGMVEKTEAGISTLKTLGVTGTNIDTGLSVMGNTIFEAGAEAKSVGDDLDRKKEEFLAKYEQLGYSEEQANEVFNQQHPDFDNQRALAMRDTFVSNVTILLGPNALMHKAIWGKAGKTFVKETNDDLLKRAGKSLTRVGKAFTSEGFWEEGSQTTVENMYVNKAMNNQLGKDDDYNIGDFTKEYINTISSTDGQKAIFLGGALGGPMMSYQGRKEDVENRKQTNEVLDNIDTQINNFNITFDNDVYQKKEDGSFVYKKDSAGNDTTERILDNKKVLNVVKSMNFSEKQSKILDAAIQAGNTDVVNSIKQQAVFNLILPSIYNGEMGIKALEQKLNADSKFQELIQRDQTSDTKDNTKSFVTETLETAKYLQKQNEKFQDFAKDIIKLDNLKATPVQKQEFLNKLNASYLNTKHQLRQDEKNLKTLELKRSAILEESNLEPNLQTEDEILVKEETNNPLLKETNDKIRNLEKNIEKSKKDIADIWKGSDKINNTFNKYIKEDEKVSKEVSDKKVQENNNLIEQIKNPEITTEEQLDKIIKDNSDLINNPLIQETINNKRNEIITAKKELEELKKQDLHNLNVNEQEVNPTDGKTKVVENTNTSLDEESTSIETSQTVEVDKNDIPIISDPKDLEQPLNFDKNQGAARVISTNKETGEPLKGLEGFLDYEREPRDKTKDKVTFELGDIKNDDEKLKNILDQIRKDSINQDLVKYLENYLPIMVTFDNNWSSFIDDMNHPNKEIVEKETLPLRKAIVKALIENKGSFKGIIGKIEKQFPGVLKMNNLEAKNNIFNLDVFKDMSEAEKIKYFQNNTIYTNWKGETLSTKTGEIVEGPQFKKGNQKHKGEVFLKIPMNNGKPFWLKLNVNTISEEKANALFDLMTIKFKLGQESSLQELEQYLINNNQTELLYSLQDEINLIKTNEPLRIDRTVNKLIDLLIHNGNQNIKTKFKIDFDGSQVEVGTLFGKLNETPNVHTITAEQLLENPEYYRKQFTKFFKYKRSNVLFKHGNSASFSNKNYINYLLNEENPILTTNAVVNEPTFGGYSNIYLAHNVENNGQVINQITEPIKEEIKPPKEFSTEEIDKLLSNIYEPIPINVSDNRNKLIAEFENLMTANPREYAKRLKAIVDSSNGKLTVSDITKGAEFVIDKMIDSELPIEGKTIKKDC